MHKITYTPYDDILYMKGEEILSDRVVPLIFGENAVELDLTAFTQVEAMNIPLGELLRIGRPIVDGPPVLGPPPMRKRGPDKQPRRTKAETEAYKAELRQFAKDNGLPVPPESWGLSRYPDGLRNKHARSLAAK